jgi:hypothetical protein
MKARHPLGSVRRLSSDRNARSRDPDHRAPAATRLLELLELLATGEEATIRTKVDGRHFLMTSMALPVARWKGTGSTDDAANFTCVASVPKPADFAVR